MKKGDRRRQEILNTAELLFCRKGYEQTSIQDILDVLNTSKGSFYHYFISKEALLAAICGKRAEQLYASVTEQIPEGKNAVERLNILFSGMIPLHGEKLSFLLMFLPIFMLPEGKSVRASYCEALSGYFSDSVRAQLEKGNEDGELCCAHPAVTAGLCLSLINRYWVLTCEMILSAEETGETADLSGILQMTDVYRNAVERVTTLPAGTVELMNLPDMKALCEQIHSHWNAANE